MLSGFSIDIYWPSSIDIYRASSLLPPYPSSATIKPTSPLLLATLFALSLVLVAKAAEPELAHAPFTFELWPSGTLTAMQPKSEAT